MSKHRRRAAPRVPPPDTAPSGDPIAVARERALPRLRQRLLRGWPRVEVSLMLALTTLAGFLCSVALLHLGVARMGLRYPVAVLVAYGVFLAQLRLWVQREARRARASGERRGSFVADAAGDVLDAATSGGGGRGGGGGLGLDLPGRGGGGTAWSGGGGRFAGGGASGSFDLPARALAVEPPSGGGSVAGDLGSSAADAVGSALDADDGWPILAAVVVIAIALSSVAAAGYVVYTAPQLLAEVFFDGAVAGVLYRRARRGAAREWWQGALSRTWIPALVVFVFFTVGGFVLERAAPGARTIGEVLRFIAAA